MYIIYNWYTVTVDKPVIGWSWKVDFAGFFRYEFINEFINNPGRMLCK